MTDDKWGFYEIGDFSIGVCPDPEQESAFGLYILIGETGFALAYYPDEEAALHALDILGQAMDHIAGQHVHGPGCEHDEGEEREITMNKPAKGKKGGKAAKGGKKSAKAAKPSKPAKAAKAAKGGKAAKASKPAKGGKAAKPAAKAAKGGKKAAKPAVKPTKAAKPAKGKAGARKR